jgi:hypothetical protein
MQALDDMSEREQAMLSEWTRVVIDEALAAGFIEMPWRPKADVYDRLTGYYSAGLTPAEAAQGCFTVHH